MRFRLVSFAAIWALAVGLGLFQLQTYSITPASGAAPPNRWPEASVLVRKPGLMTVVMLAHPQCPCTRASLSELAIAAAQAGGRLDLHVVFLKSDEFLLETDLWRAALEIPNARVLADSDGVEIQKFGVTASGHTLVYNAAGRLVFSGGVVSARGHAGANRGRRAIVDLAQHGRSEDTTFPVFGCALQNRESIAAVRQAWNVSP